MHGHGLFTTIILPAFCMQVECGLTHYVQNIGYGSLKTECRGGYFDLRGRSKHRTGGNGMICTTWMVKSRMRWVGYVAEKKCIWGFDGEI
jgi:hypothetical protein